MAEQTASEYFRRDMEALMETVFGNGHPGLKLQVHEHNLILKNWKDTIDQFKRVFFTVMATLVGAAIIAVVASHVTAYKTNSNEELLQRLEKRLTIQSGAASNAATQ